MLLPRLRRRSAGFGSSVVFPFCVPHYQRRIRTIAVGIYTDAKGRVHGFAVNRNNAKFYEIVPPGGVGNNIFANAINDCGDVTGFITSSNEVAIGYVLEDNRFTEFQFPGSKQTQPFGINARGEIVGFYIDTNGGSHGFTLEHGKFQSVDDPKGVVGSTSVYGVNDEGEIVGNYSDTTGNLHGFLAMKK